MRGGGALNTARWRPAGGGGETLKGLRGGKSTRRCGFGAMGRRGGDAAVSCLWRR